MSEKIPKNIGTSVRQRLLNLSRQQNIDLGVMLSNYALERFLYRLSCSVLCSAIGSTFERRSTIVPATTPIALSLEFCEDNLKTTQWRAFVGGGNVRLTSLTLREIVDVLSSFLIPPMTAASQERQFDAKWIPSGPWI